MNDAPTKLLPAYWAKRAEDLLKIFVDEDLPTTSGRFSRTKNEVKQNGRLEVRHIRDGEAED